MALPASSPLIVDSAGLPMRRAEGAVGVPPAYQAADILSQELAGWHPGLSSPDTELRHSRNQIVARIRDLVRNNGWASAALTRFLDSVVGADLRLSAKPDARALGLSAEWAAEFSRVVEGRWRLWAHDPDRWADAARRLTIAGLFRLAYRHDWVDGDALAVLLWRPSPGRMATRVRLVDPDRLSNPPGEPESEHLRGGVELDEEAAAIAYHFRKGHPGDRLRTSASFEWERVPRETSFGRPIVVHHFEPHRADQTRGIGRLAPVVERLFMLGRYDRVELQASVLNAVLAAFIESPFDSDMVSQALSSDGLSGYQEQRAAFHSDSRLTLGGVRIPHLYSGEKLSFQTAQRPSSNFGDFEAACLRNIASGAGLSYEQLSMDWTQTNYSSARAALLEVWRTFGSDRHSFAQGFCTPIYCAWLEEAIDRGDVVLPPEAPPFRQAKGAYTRCNWIGPGRGWVDPVKEAQAAVLRMAAGLSTLERECAEQGLDYQEILAQRRRELDEMEALGLPFPDWANVAAMTGGGGAGAAPGPGAGGGSTNDERQP